MKRSIGQGGATGCTANIGRCAVERCFRAPKPHACPYDGAYHRHGAIHYDCGDPQSELTFRQGDWYQVCDEHYVVLCSERRAFEADNGPAPFSGGSKDD